MSTTHVWTLVGAVVVASLAACRPQCRPPEAPTASTAAPGADAEASSEAGSDTTDAGPASVDAESTADAMQSSRTAPGERSGEQLGGPVPPHSADASQQDDACRRTAGCERFGACEVGPDRTCLTSADGCAQSKGCRDRGACSPTEDRLGCRIAGDEDCEKSPRCEWGGVCKLGPDGRCVTSTAGCAASTGCRDRGACSTSASPLQCQPSSQQHCEDSVLCERNEACKFAANPDGLDSCVPACDSEWADSYRACVRGAGTDCSDTRACKEFDLCVDGGGRRCLRQRECRDTSACRDEGRCNVGYEEGTCEAYLSEDCRASTGCKNEGKCSAYGGECVDEERVAEICGWPDAVLEDGACYRPLGYDCTKECKDYNRCRAREYDGRYVVCVETEEYCRNQPDCRYRGLCTVGERRLQERNRCYSASDSKFACGGYVYGRCVKSEEACAKSVDCKKRGNCSARTGSQYCRPTRNEHCLQSEICEAEGQCKLLDESSYYICGD